MTTATGVVSHALFLFAQWLTSPPASPDSVINIAQVMQVDAGISGTIAGFALAVVILLIDHTRRNDDRTMRRLLEAAILTFFAAFFVLVFTSFVFAEGGAQQPPTSHRAFVVFSCPLFLFSIALTFLFIGFITLLGAYQLDYALGIVRLFYFAGLFLVAVYYSSAIDDATSPQLTDSASGVLLWAAIVATALSALASRWHRRYWIRSGHLVGLRRYVGIATVACIASYLFMSWVEDQPSASVAPRWLGAFLMCTLSALAGWSAAYIPDGPRTTKDRADPGAPRSRGDGGRVVARADPWDKA